MEPYLFNLRKDHFDSDLIPKKSLVDTIAKAVFRNGDTSLPGHVFITNPLQVLRSVRWVEGFTRIIVNELYAREYGRDLEYRDETDFPGHMVIGVPPHFDTPGSGIGCLHYFPRENIRGGHPQLYDVLKLVEDGKVDSIDDAVFVRHDPERNVDLKSEILEAFPEYGCTVELAYGLHPVLFFNNNYSDGIMHTCTTPTPLDPTVRERSRPMRYVGYDE